METFLNSGVLLLCVGAIVLVALVAFVFRAMSRGGGSTQYKDPMVREPVEEEPIVPVDTRPISDVENFGGVPATGAREYDTERGIDVTDQDRYVEDVNPVDPTLDRDQSPYDRDAGDIDDEYDNRPRRDDEVL